MQHEERMEFERVQILRGASLLGECVEHIMCSSDEKSWHAAAVMSKSREDIDRSLAALGLSGEIHIDPHVAGRTAPDRTLVPSKQGLEPRGSLMKRGSMVIELSHALSSRLLTSRRRLLVITVKVDGEAFYHADYTYAFILHSQDRIENLLPTIVSAYYRNVLGKDMPKPPAVLSATERDEIAVKPDMKELLGALDAVEGVPPMLPIERISAGIHAMSRRLDDLDLRLGRMEAALVHLSDQMTGIERAINEHSEDAK